MSGSGEARMLERRISNNRADLSGDQRMNFFLTWFNEWSELQRSDFVTVLAEKMNPGDLGSKAVPEAEGRKVDGPAGDSNRRHPSLYDCRVKLFREWFSGWSDDQKNYLVTRLQALDSEFYDKYERHVADPASSALPPKDYFEPGVPPEMVRKSSRSVVGGYLNGISYFGSDGKPEKNTLEEREEDGDQNGSGEEVGLNGGADVASEIL